MITVIAHDTAAAGAADTVRQLLARHAAASRAEPGCLQFDAHQGIDSPDESALVERDESQAAFAEHRRTPHLRRNVETELVELFTARSRRCPGQLCSGQLCDATYDVLTPCSRDRSRRADMNA
jgi:quinol monooxygenase YgiN